MRVLLILLVLSFAWAGCRESSPTPVTDEDPKQTISLKAILAQQPTDPPAATQSVASAPTPLTTVRVDYDTTEWMEVIQLDPSVPLDLRYATDNNFVGEQMYDCGRCFLRKKVAQALVTAHRELQKQGLGLKMYDCYRPRPVQQKLWNKVPDRRYVADPKKGSVHNRGGAVDLTIVDVEGNELPMGTDYDYFGKEAWPSYQNLPREVLNNRKLLAETLGRYGFKAIKTEWWHFGFAPQQYALADWEWPCTTNEASIK